ncbi:MAG: hypothetical protein HWQ40_31715 [Nostoc sp. NMS9]|nr:hypothetical protein [Nostoc sp. NMS9]
MAIACDTCVSPANVSDRTFGKLRGRLFHGYLTNVPFDFAQGMFCLGKSITATAMPAAGVAIALLENFRGDRFQR